MTLKTAVQQTKPIRALELHYPMIQFLTIIFYELLMENVHVFP